MGKVPLACHVEDLGVWNDRYFLPTQQTLLDVKTTDFTHAYIGTGGTPHEASLDAWEQATAAGWTLDVTQTDVCYDCRVPCVPEEQEYLRFHVAIFLRACPDHILRYLERRGTPYEQIGGGPVYTLGRSGAGPHTTAPPAEQADGGPCACDAPDQRDGDVGEVGGPEGSWVGAPDL